MFYHLVLFGLIQTIRTQSSTSYNDYYDFQVYKKYPGPVYTKLLTVHANHYMPRPQQQFEADNANTGIRRRVIFQTKNRETPSRTPNDENQTGDVFTQTLQTTTSSKFNSKQKNLVVQPSNQFPQSNLDK
jgi:hypothetical protein